MLLTQFSGEAKALTEDYWQAIGRLARIEFAVNTDRPGDAHLQVEKRQASKGIQITMPGMLAILQLEGVVDLEAEKARLSKGAAVAEKERDGLAQRLANPNFTERAKPEAVEKARADHDAKAAEAERLRAALERLG